ncbi:carboxypeptidase-like regulatory domain-containing protein [Thalassoroseus pseudoceratinae]|uniref:carboxypeptidase-like regulatory domain-containing protein n=1 Tax=Thalassoroseus pseudoceratinae TaxID=2713176 RepID=UPI00142232B5|nr:carboxypeptidase-like regulatory domain-containing protein [Thalassoroseus pseudoceratinae]
MRLLLGLTLVVLGCGGSGEDKWTKDRPEVVDAEGVVTYQNEPVEGATVVFAPTDGKHAASGLTDSSGQFSVSAFPNSEGAVPGSYKVTVTKMETPSASGGGDGHGEAVAAPKNLLPAKYAETANTPLTADVPASGKTDFQFDLSD